MKSYTSKNFVCDTPCVLALGCFDGVHRGHSAVISRAAKIARDRGLAVAVWTFREPPKNFFSPGSAPIITNYSEKKRLIRKLGVDILVCLPFDNEISSLSPEEFFSQILVEKMHAEHIVCGFNYSFGKGGKGNTELLRKLCLLNNIEFETVSEVLDGGVTISSSAIRAAIESGDTERAERYLGRPFSISSKVVDGQKLARKLGFPTLNQIPEKNMLIPRRGVYISRITFGRKNYFGITNVGVRPTAIDHTLSAESHIFGFDGDLYGRTVRTEFLHFLRPEKEFSSLDALQAQVLIDIENAKAYIREKYSN